MLRTLACLAASAAVLAHAAITRFEVEGYRSIGMFRPGESVRVEGRVFGELDPRLDMGIVGLDRAPRNAQGLVEYSARVVITGPNQLSKSNGTLIVDIPQGGRANAQALFNSPGEPSKSGTPAHRGDFLQDNGFMVAEIQWEQGQGAELPSFVDAEGRKRLVEGVAFAIVRDTADYLHWGMLDSKQRPNPLRGAVQRVIATERSDGGGFLRSFLVGGFNDARGRRVFDGLAIFPGAGDEPSAYAKLVANIPPANEALPRVMFINSTADPLPRGSSPDRRDARGALAVDLPSNLRVYDIAGESHATEARALLLKLVAWVADGVAPPPSRLAPRGREGPRRDAATPPPDSR